MKTNSKIRPFGFRDKMGYLFGDFGNDFTFILSTSILMKFYTDVMGVSAAVVGTIMMLARFVDAITDVTMGRICDRSRTTKAGKFKPWILRMCVPVALASFMMYLRTLLAPARQGEFQRIFTGDHILDRAIVVHQQQLYCGGTQIDANIQTHTHLSYFSFLLIVYKFLRHFSMIKMYNFERFFPQRTFRRYRYVFR